MLGDAQPISQAVTEEANLKLSLVQAAFGLAPAAPSDFQHDGVCILEGLSDRSPLIWSTRSSHWPLCVTAFLTHIG